MGAQQFRGLLILPKRASSSNMIRIFSASPAASFTTSENFF
jgi:hypothetical protein